MDKPTKYIKICNEPFYVNRGNKRGVIYDTGYIEEYLYDKIMEFQDFPYEEAIAGKVFTNEEFQEKVDKLMGYSNGRRYYAFNVTKNKPKPNVDTNTYYRSLVSLGNKTIVKHTMLKSIQAFFMRLFA